MAEGNADEAESPGAQSLVRDYIQAANDALTDAGAMTVWRELFADSCQVCLDGYETAQRIHADGLLVTGGVLRDWRVTGQEADLDSSVVVVTGVLEPATIRAADGSVAETYDGLDPITIIYTTELDGTGEWQVTGAQVVS